MRVIRRPAPAGAVAWGVVEPALMALAVLAVAVLGLAVLPPALGAQQAELQGGRRARLVELPEPSRRGFWIAFGSGTAIGPSYALAGNGAGARPEVSERTLFLRLGATLDVHWRVGVEGLVWSRRMEIGGESVRSLLVIAQWYPPPRRSGFHLKGGAGVGRSSVTVRDGGGTAEAGLAGIAGLGWEIGLGRKLALSPGIDLVQQFHRADPSSDGYRDRLVRVGLGILFQTGR